MAGVRLGNQASGKSSQYRPSIPRWYSLDVVLPIKRDALKERAALDAADEAEQYQRESPEQRFRIGLALSELARKLARAAGAEWITSPPDDLADKARLYAEPLRRLCHS